MMSVRGYLLGSLILLTACSSGLEEGPELETQAVAKTLEIPLSNNADDAEQSGSRLVKSGKALDFSQDGQTVALRFTDVKVPQGAKIKVATISFTAIAADSAPVKLQVRAENADNAAPFGRSVGDRTQTSAVAAWNPKPWRRELATRTWNLSSVVQEVVSRDGWESGNALAFYVTGDRDVKRSAYARDKSSSRTPRLKITFEANLKPDADPEPRPPEGPKVPSSSCLKSGVTRKLSGDYRSKIFIRNGKNAVIDARDAKLLARAAFLAENNSGSLCLSGGFLDSDLSDDTDWDTFHNSAGLLFYRTPNAIIENMTIHITGDGITIKNDNPNWLFRDSYIRHAGDDGVENDRFNNGTVDDVLIDWAYTGLSCRKEQKAAKDVSYTFKVQNTLIALKPQEGTYNRSMGRGGAPGHNQLFKVTQNVSKGCRLALKNNVFLISSYAGYIDPSDDPKVKYDILDRSACRGNKNTIVYTGGSAAYLRQLRAAAPECFDVTTDVNVWKTARAKWFDRHPRFSKYRNNEPRGAR